MRTCNEGKENEWKARCASVLSTVLCEVREGRGVSAKEEKNEVRNEGRDKGRKEERNEGRNKGREKRRMVGG